MRKSIVAAVAAGVGATLLIAGCSPADQASQNISQSAENFRVVRQLTVINGFTDTVQFQLVGNFSIEVDDADSQLEVTVKTGKNTFRKHFVGLSDNVSYVVEDLDETEDADAWVYQVFYLPGQPVTVELEK